ncbi:hypothetical protein HK097_003936 [Rhizophlyctis rosea]|uniref:Uncharacterized protein n=1 Tax=Rhizophlyctis rosea TaxID=64517 RepID=A0AAD5S201_9FUNG|nr:hypothetical protein HK097_003936 [Rhizophlyctis rosea]
MLGETTPFEEPQFLRAVQYAMDNFKIGDDDPAYVFSWKEPHLVSFANAANLGIGIVAPRPASIAPGLITSNSLKSNLMMFFSALGGGNWEDTMIGPNDAVQANRITSRIADWQRDQWVQQVAAAAGLPVGARLGYLALVLDRRQASGTPLTLPPAAAPAITLFQ